MDMDDEFREGDISNIYHLDRPILDGQVHQIAITYVDPHAYNERMHVWFLDRKGRLIRFRTACQFGRPFDRWSRGFIVHGWHWSRYDQDSYDQVVHTLRTHTPLYKKHGEVWKTDNPDTIWIG